jgi:hypothetical protein
MFILEQPNYCVLWNIDQLPYDLIYIKEGSCIRGISCLNSGIIQTELRCPKISKLIGTQHTLLNNTGVAYKLSYLDTPLTFNGFFQKYSGVFSRPIAWGRYFPHEKMAPTFRCNCLLILAFCEILALLSLTFEIIINIAIILLFITKYRMRYERRYLFDIFGQSGKSYY